MTALLVLLVLVVVGLLPAWPYSVGWSYYPSGGALLVAVIAVLLLTSNRRRGSIV